MFKFDEIKYAFVYYHYVRFLDQKQDSYEELTETAIYFLEEIPVNLLHRAIISAQSEGFLDLHRAKNKSYYKITDSGIKFCESSGADLRIIYKKMFVNFFYDPQMHRSLSLDVWKMPDQLGEISSESLEKIKKLLDECIKQIDEVKLSQQDKSDAYQKIKSAQNMSEAPRPYLGVIYRIIHPFTNSFLAESAKEIVKRLLGG